MALLTHTGHPAVWNLTPFTAVDPWPWQLPWGLCGQTDSGRNIYELQGNLRKLWCAVQRGAERTGLINPLISTTCSPTGLECSGGSCLDWLQERTQHCNYLDDWRQRLPLLIKALDSCSPSWSSVERQPTNQPTNQWTSQASPPFLSDTFKTFSESLQGTTKLSVGCNSLAVWKLYLGLHNALAISTILLCCPAGQHALLRPPAGLQTTQKGGKNRTGKQDLQVSAEMCF